MSVDNKEDDPNDTYAFSSEGEDSDVVNPAAEALLVRCTSLLSEVESFIRSLRRAKLEKTVELRMFLNQIKAEHRCIQGLCLEDPGSSRSRHGVRACNLPYLEALWKAAKDAKGITAMCKSFLVEDGDDREKRKAKAVKKQSVSVDVVAQNGLQWIKVSLLTPRRLLMELAKQGWEVGASNSGSEDDNSKEPSLATSTLALTSLTESLVRASAQARRIQYLHPTVHILLPNLEPTPSTPEINTFISTLTNLGAHVQCGPAFFSPSRSVDEMVADLSSPIQRYNKPLSNPLNLDTTILLALVSDLSNSGSVAVEQRFHPAILRQIEQETEAAMLPVHLWPVLGGRELVCSPSAFARFREIVDVVASETERARADALMDPDPEQFNKFRELCYHPLPADGMLLPIQKLDADGDVEDGDEEVFRRVAANLSGVNRAVFLAGWRQRLTTVTTNRSVARFIEAAVGKSEVGPDVYIVETARSLIGKAKRIEISGC